MAAVDDDDFFLLDLLNDLSLREWPIGQGGYFSDFQEAQTLREVESLSYISSVERRWRRGSGALPLPELHRWMAERAEPSRHQESPPEEPKMLALERRLQAVERQAARVP